MARPRLYDVDDAIDAAMRVFWRKGYALTSMADLYAATGLRPGNLYATFTDKGTLFRRIFAAYAEWFRRTLPTDVEGTAAIRAWLRLQARLACEDPDRKGCLIVNTVTEREAHDEETRALAMARLAEITAFFRDHLGRAENAGDLGPGPGLDARAAALTGAVVAIMALARAGAPAAMIEAVAEAAILSVGQPAPEALEAETGR